MIELISVKQWIESKEWDHLQFLKSILIVVLITVLMLYLWLLLLIITQKLNQELVQVIFREMLTNNLLGAIAGMLIGVAILLPYYLRKEWDLHKVVPSFMFYFLIIIVIAQFSSLFVFTKVNQISKLAFLIGIVIGGFIAVIAYAGEVMKEHQEANNEPLLIEE